MKSATHGGKDAKLRNNQVVEQKTILGDNNETSILENNDKRDSDRHSKNKRLRERCDENEVELVSKKKKRYDNSVAHKTVLNTTALMEMV